MGSAFSLGTHLKSTHITRLSLCAAAALQTSHKQLHAGLRLLQEADALATATRCLQTPARHN